MMARPKQVTDEELLQVALECFLEFGPQVSTQVIADRVGLSQPALFKRYGTKEELFLQAVAPPERLPAIEWLDASPTPRPLRPQIVEMLEKVSATIAWVLPRIQLLRSSGIPAATVMTRYETPPPISLIMSIAGFFECAQQQHRLHPGVTADFCADTVFGILTGRTFAQDITSQETASNHDLFIESCADLVCRGLLDNEHTK